MAVSFPSEPFTKQLILVEIQKCSINFNEMTLELNKHGAQFAQFAP